MRISTNTIYDGGSARMGDLQAAMLKTQSQLATGLRVQSPSDDPVAASRAIEVAQSMAINAQQVSNRNAARGSLSQVESSLASVSTLIDDAKSQIVAAGNGALDDTQRRYIATNLRSRLDELLSIGNAKDGSGNYLYAGYQTSTQPFAQTTTGAQYNGDQGQRLIQVSSSRQMAISETGQAIFQGGGQDIFKTLTDAITLLETPTAGNPGASAALTTGLATTNTELDKAIDNVSTVRASIGSRLAELDNLDELGEAFDTQFQKTMSDLQDLDYTKAITELSQQQVTLEAAQKSFLSITKLSLFNYI